MFDQLSGPVVLICGQSKPESAPKEKEKLVSIIKCILLMFFVLIIYLLIYFKYVTDDGFSEHSTGPTGKQFLLRKKKLFVFTHPFLFNELFI